LAGLVDKRIAGGRKPVVCGTASLTDVTPFRIANDLTVRAAAPVENAAVLRITAVVTSTARIVNLPLKIIS
jgi:hypothetical protein